MGRKMATRFSSTLVNYNNTTPDIAKSEKWLESILKTDNKKKKEKKK